MDETELKKLIIRVPIPDTGEGDLRSTTGIIEDKVTGITIATYVAFSLGDESMHVEMLRQVIRHLESVVAGWEEEHAQTNPDTSSDTGSDPT